MLKWLLIPIVLLIAGVFALVMFNTDFFVDMLWFNSLGYLNYFLQRLSYRFGIFAFIALIFFLIFFLNFWLASRFLGRDQAQPTEQKRRFSQMLRNVSMAVYGPLSFIMAIPIALPFFKEWEKALFFFFGRKAGIVDPAIGRDVSYYFFKFPIFQLIQGRLVIVFLILFFALALLYWLENRLLSKEDRALPFGARFHMTVTILFTFAIMGWGFLLEQDALLFTTAHEPIFSGPGWIEWSYIRPLIWGTIAFFALSALSLIVLIHARKGKLALALFVPGLLLCFVLKETPYVQNTWYKWFKVEKQVKTESPFITKNIEATRAAYNLEGVKIRKYRMKETHDILSNPIVETSLRNLPVWDQELLNDVYNQEQGFHANYTIPNVDVDRYTVKGKNQQVYLAAREFNFVKIAKSQPVWDKKHLYYTHGYGIVMTPAAQGGDENMTWFIRDIPTRSDYDLTIAQPRIYYGFEEIDEYDYVIAPNRTGEYDYPLEDSDSRFNYDGKGGIPIDSMLMRILFYWHYDREIKFLTARENIISKSRILIRRNVGDMIGKLTPFLEFDSDPYLVSTAKGLFWIQDAYTTSAYYPYARKWKGKLNYIRNSVKIVVDAYNGSVEYFISEPRDPIINAYKRIYRPLKFKRLDQMDGELREHLRYPKDLFQIQMEMFAKYHQSDPERFYNDEDTWVISQTAHAGQPADMRPYYLTLNLFDSGRNEFMLVCPMSPKDRSNLRALALVECDGDRYGKITVYRFPRGRQVYGPSQIDSLIDQDTEISQQLTLWDQVGSQVARGRIIILPVGDLLLYVQPVYLSSASRLKIPELKRIIVSQGEVFAMAPSMEEAFAKLELKVKDRIERKAKRFPIDLPEKNVPVPAEGVEKPAQPDVSVTTEPAAAPSGEGVLPEPAATQPVGESVPQASPEAILNDAAPAAVNPNPVPAEPSSSEAPATVPPAPAVPEGTSVPAPAPVVPEVNQPMEKTDL